METNANKTLNIGLMTRIALITAVTCILAPMSVPIPISPVPISLTNLVIFISLFILDYKSATISYVLYLLLGLVGLPVFSGFSGGAAKLVGPTGGYLIGLMFLALVGGIFADRSHKANNILIYLIGAILGEVIVYVLGTAWLSRQMGITFVQALFAGVIPYLPGDAVKLIIAVIVGPQIRRRIKGFEVQTPTA